MSEIIPVATSDVMPDVLSLLVAQGMRSEVKPKPKIRRLAEEACELFAGLAQPRGIFAEISLPDFEAVYRGLGCNESPAPLENIYPHACDLALSAVTVGEDICRKITDLFREGDFALGSLLDAAASEGTEKAAHCVEHYFETRLATEGRRGNGNSVMAYSPGYCGWHISAQRKLFEWLHPERIGIHLRESFLMEPIKSTSIAMIHGPQEIHRFAPRYSFCRQCRTKTCLLRMEAVRG